jgi:hypothetical protein
MKTSNKREPQVNPPRMTSHDLSDAEMEIRELIAKREKGEENQSVDSSDNDPGFQMNAGNEENLN